VLLHDVHWKDRPGSRFSECVDLFDLVATTRQWHAAELLAAGAKAVSVVRFGFEPSGIAPSFRIRTMLHTTAPTRRWWRTYEASRGQDLGRLCDGGGFRLSLWGNSGTVAGLLAGAGVWRGRDAQEQEIPVIYACARRSPCTGWDGNPKALTRALRQGDQHTRPHVPDRGRAGAMMLPNNEEHRKSLKKTAKQPSSPDALGNLPTNKTWLLARCGRAKGSGVRSPGPPASAV